MRLADIVSLLGGEIRGDGQVDIVQVAPLERAQAQEIGFVAQAKYRAALQTTQAGAVILPAALAGEYAGNCVVAANPHVYFAQVAQLLNPQPKPAPGVHAQACVLSQVPASVSVAPFAYVAEDCAIGEGVIIGPGCVVGRGVSIGAGTLLHANVTIYAHSLIGADCILHAGSVVGSDGFGYARHREGKWEKIPQIGRAILGDRVELGANATVDRGALDDTVIGSGVKIDNLCHVAHNCTVGDDSAMAAHVGIAGSTRIGSRVMLGGKAGINGHIEIGNDIVISGGSNVTKTITEPGVYTALFPAVPHKEWMHDAARFRQLEAMQARMREMEKRLQELESKK